MPELDRRADRGRIFRRAESIAHPLDGRLGPQTVEAPIGRRRAAGAGEHAAPGRPRSGGDPAGQRQDLGGVQRFLHRQHGGDLQPITQHARTVATPRLRPGSQGHEAERPGIRCAGQHQQIAPAVPDFDRLADRRRVFGRAQGGR